MGTGALGGESRLLFRRCFFWSCLGHDLYRAFNCGLGFFRFSISGRFYRLFDGFGLVSSRFVSHVFLW
jgi:hypothetical protein